MNSGPGFTDLSLNLEQGPSTSSPFYSLRKTRTRWDPGVPSRTGVLQPVIIVWVVHFGA